MTYKVIMSSDEFGAEEFEYDSPAEREAGLRRLMRSAKWHKEQDGITRRFETEDEDADGAASECSDACAEHAPGCDGLCDHYDDHTNGCKK